MTQPNQMPDGFWAQSAADPNRTVLIEPDGRQWSAGLLSARSNRLVHALRAAGLERGDAFAVVLPNGAEFLTAYLAATQAGFYLVPVNHHLTGPEIAWIVADSGAKVLIAHERFGEAAAAAADEAELPGTHRYELVIRHRKRHEEHAFPVEIADGRFRAALPAVPTASFAGRVPLHKGTWTVLFRPVGAAADSAWPAAALAASTFDTLPLEVEARGKTATLERRLFDSLSLESQDPLTPAERSGYRQRQLRHSYAELQRRPLTDSVLYHTVREDWWAADGGLYNDSPRAVHEELVGRGLPLRHLWTSVDLQADLPQTAECVRHRSPEWFEALATAKYIVTSTHLPTYFRRRPGQVVLQTWQGTPLKRVGTDFEKVWFTDAGYLEHLKEEVPQWSLLVAGSRWAAPVLRRAFDFEGKVLESGYPRNDLLFATDREKTAERVREQLGLPEGKQVVLYAPTFREDRRLPDGGYQLNLQLDLEAARAALGDDQVLLVRGHEVVRAHIPEAGNGYVWDVSTYPDMAELLLVADVLVTDYSAAVFDFMNTGRPVLFFTYDLEHYRDNLRGFSLDLAAQAPGPLLATSAEVVAALGDLPQVTAEYADKYAAFREAYCDLDDGKAAVRVADALLAEGE